MPRSFQLFPQNAGITSNPTDTLSFDPTSIIGSAADALAAPSLLELAENWIKNFLTVLDDITGLDLVTFWNSLTTLFGELIPGSGSFNPLGAVETFFGLVIDFWEDLPGELINALIQLFTGGLLGTIVTALGGTAIGKTVEELLSDVGSLLGGLITTIVSAIATAITGIESFIGNPLGTIENWARTLFSAVPVGSLTNTQPNLLTAPTFTSDAIVPGSEWSVDMSTSRTDDGSGSLMITANGYFHALRSGSEPSNIITVGAGQILTVSIYAINDGYSGAGVGAPVQLQIAPFDGSVLADFVTVDTYTPTGDITDWAYAHELTGSYSVPTGVSAVQLRLFINDTAQTGTFHFDDGSLAQTAQIQQSWISGLVDTFQGVFNQIQAFIDTIVSALSGIPIIGSVLSDLDDALKAIESGNILGALGATTIGGDIQSVIDTLISAFTGIPTTGGSTADLHNAIVSSITGTDGSDETFYYVAAGTVTIPSWANYTDIVLVGPGQGGAQGEIFGLNGNPGAPGKFNATTLTLSSDYSVGDTITYTPGTAGAANGGVGTATTASIGVHSLSAAAGDIAEGLQWLGGVAGPGPGTFAYNDQNYVGGSTQNQHGQNGLTPGGAGAGGNGALFESGGAGAPGAVWVRFRADDVADPSSGADTTAPSTPTVEVVSATNDTLTFSATGSVDG